MVMNIIMQLVCVCIVGLIILLFVGISYEYIATKYDDLRYPAPGQFVQVNGKKVHYVCRGRKAPTIVLDAGLGADHNWWDLVQNEASSEARIVSFDRPGYGWSAAATTPRTSENIVSELHDLLQAARLTAPYILVGHSFGGANMRLYANTYPEEVAGFILVEACHEDQNFEEDLSNKNILVRCKNYLLSSALTHYVGISRWFMAESLEPFFSPLMPELLQNTIIAKASSIKSLQTRDNEMILLKKSLSQLKRSKNSLEDKPVIVITAEKTNNDPQWQQYQKQLVSLSKKGKQIIAKGSSHMVIVDKPEVIIEAIKEVIELCNSSKIQ